MTILNKFYASVISIIRGLFGFLMLITLIAAIRYPEINFSHLSNKQFLLTVVLTIISVMILLLVIKRNDSKIRTIGIVLLSVSFILQFLAIKNSFFPVGYDVSSVFSLLSGKNIKFNEFYFSLNPNNIPVVILYKGILELLNLHVSWVNLEYITTVLVDLGIIANLVSIKLLKENSFNVALYFYTFFALVFSFILVPYTDSLAYAIVSLYTCFFLLSKKIRKNRYKMLTLTLFLLFVIFGYFIKPSSIIPFIAILIVQLLMILKNRKQRILSKKLFIYIVPVLLGIGFFLGCSSLVSNQKMLKIQPDRDKPVTSFILIGMQGIGAYSPAEDQVMQSLPTKKARNDYCIKQIKKQLKEYGPVGYIKFLLTIKQAYNTRDGMFGWTVDGVDAIPRKAKNIFQNYNYPIGNLFSVHQILAQFLWILIIALSLFSLNSKDIKVVLLQLAVVGGMLFLLLFEGGRTRYMIQFLPPIQLLAIYSYRDFIYRTKKYIFG